MKAMKKTPGWQLAQEPEPVDRWVRGGGAGGVVRWEANRGGTRDRGEFQGCDATLETGRKPKNVVKRDSTRKKESKGSLGKTNRNKGTFQKTDK